MDLVCRAGKNIFVSKHRQLTQLEEGRTTHTFELPERPTVLAPAHEGAGVYVALKDGQFYIVANGSARELVSVRMRPLLMAFKNAFVEGLEGAVLAESFARLTGPLVISQSELRQIPGFTAGFGVPARDMAAEMEFDPELSKKTAVRLAAVRTSEELIGLAQQLRAEGFYYNSVLLDYLVCRELGLELLFKACSDETKAAFWRMYGINLFALGGE